LLRLLFLQVTNRDLSIAVLRKFLPQLAQELSDGTVNRNKNTFPRVKQEPAGQVRQAAGWHIAHHNPRLTAAGCPDHHSLEVRRYFML
jgi:hypothetical protein